MNIDNFDNNFVTETKQNIIQPKPIRKTKSLTMVAQEPSIYIQEQGIDFSTIKSDPEIVEQIGGVKPQFPSTPLTGGVKPQSPSTPLTGGVKPSVAGTSMIVEPELGLPVKSSDIGLGGLVTPSVAEAVSAYEELDTQTDGMAVLKEKRKFPFLLVGAVLITSYFVFKKK
jgi:hypothetical protein